MPPHAPSRQSLCLVHPDRTVRSILAFVAQELNFPPVEVFNTPQAAARFIQTHRPAALMIWTDDPPALELIERIRGAELNCPADLPLVILAPPCSASQVRQWLAFKPVRLLLTPFRIKDLIQTLEQLAQSPAVPG
jgi:CheY-like chemotaxis protein